MCKIKYIVAVAILTVNGSLWSQTITLPNSALKSHETLEIRKVVLSENSTEVYLKIENRISNGTFCADRNIYIVYPDGTRIRMISSNGIPVCPDSYSFKRVGEQLDFILKFPPLRKGIASVNLIEDCQDNCFSFYDVILDNDLNMKINDAFAYAEKDEPLRAAMELSRIVTESNGTAGPADGLLFLSLVKLYTSAGNKVKAAEWYRKIESSGLPETSLYLKHLNSIGIKY
jgi:hypothetical protein